MAVVRNITTLTDKQKNIKTNIMNLSIPQQTAVFNKLNVLQPGENISDYQTFEKLIHRIRSNSLLDDANNLVNSFGGPLA